MMEIVARQGAIHHGGRSELVVVDGAMNCHWYIQILRNEMLPWATAVFGHNFVYVQDNAPPQTARDTEAFLDQRYVEVMDWPARSPDMDPIEYVWDQMPVWIGDMHDPHPPTPPPPNPHPPAPSPLTPNPPPQPHHPPQPLPSSVRKGADPGREHAS